MLRFPTLGLLAVLAVLLLAACQPNYTAATVTPTDIPIEATLPPTVAPTEAAPTTAPTETAPTPVAEVLPPTAQPISVAQTLPIERNDYFATSGQCAICHTRMTDAAGNDVSLDTQWWASMMANSARDPYWQASVRAEIVTSPDYADFIQDKCATCHMPMARFTYHVHDQPGLALDDGFLDPANDLHVIAMDSISCSLCHQFLGDTLGTPDSFSGHYEIDTTVPMGERLAFGPFPVPETQAIVMQASSGFIPTQVDYISDAAVCGSCHTLFTPSLNARGEIVGEFPEQMAYPEWLHSRFSETDTCQTCHMPAAEDGVVLSVTGGEARSPFMQHIFVGGNAYMPDLLRRHRDELEFTASDALVEANIDRVLTQLATSTGGVTIDSVSRDGTALVVEVTVTNQAGHKLPTSYPSRRAWLHVTVTDAAGDVVFESGAFNADGSITGNDNDADQTRFEPHYTSINDPGQVQIYEAIMRTVEGDVTTSLLYGNGYLKDNRLLPEGFDKPGAPEEIRVQGAAAEDEDFTGGSDRLRYIVEVGQAGGPYTITVELLYQSIGYRWAHNLARVDTPDTARFLAFYSDTPSPALRIAQAALQTDL